MNSNQIQTDLLPCGIVKLCSQRKIVSCNSYALNLITEGVTDGVIGCHINELTSVATQIFLDSYVYPMLLEAGNADEIQLTLKSLAGDAKPVVTNIRMGSDQSSYWTFMSCVNRDNLYTEMLNSKETLVAQGLELSQLNELILERQSDLEAFCNSLSHDFTAPLQKISKLIEFTLEDLEKEGVAAADPIKMLTGASKSTVVLMDLTQGLVEYLVADVAVLLDETVDLEEIVSTVLSMHANEDNNIPAVHWTSLPTIIGSRSQIYILFKNLLDNAIKYNQNKPEISISHSEDVSKKQVVLSIKDNGIGMSEEYLDSIFNPFTRLNTASAYKGSGLGLSIVKKMVNNHNGEIRVESELGAGSTFYISFPLSQSVNNKLN